MLSSFRKLVADFIRDESGQGINEYAAILAFLSMLCFFVFGFAQGGLVNALSATCSNCSSQMAKLNSYTST